MALIVKKQGYTLVELMVTLVLSILVAMALFTVYEWSAKLGTLCGKKNRSQVAAINSSVRIMDCIRNASSISSMDSSHGRWVELSYPDGSTAVLAYTNSPGTASRGALGLFRVGKSPAWFVKNGITGMMDSQGYTYPVFLTNSCPNILYVKYRVSQPAESGGRDTDDGKYAIYARFATCLRNASQN